MTSNPINTSDLEARLGSQAQNPAVAAMQRLQDLDRIYSNAKQVQTPVPPPVPSGPSFREKLFATTATLKNAPLMVSRSMPLLAARVEPRGLKPAQILSPVRTPLPDAEWFQLKKMFDSEMKHFRSSLMQMGLSSQDLANRVAERVVEEEAQRRRQEGLTDVVNEAAKRQTEAVIELQRIWQSCWQDTRVFRLEVLQNLEDARDQLQEAIYQRGSPSRIRRLKKRLNDMLSQIDEELLKADSACVPPTVEEARKRALRSRSFWLAFSKASKTEILDEVWNTVPKTRPFRFAANSKLPSSQWEVVRVTPETRPKGGDEMTNKVVSKIPQDIDDRWEKLKAFRLTDLINSPDPPTKPPVKRTEVPSKPVFKSVPLTVKVPTKAVPPQPSTKSRAKPPAKPKVSRKVEVAAARPTHSPSMISIPPLQRRKSVQIYQATGGELRPSDSSQRLSPSASAEMVRADSREAYMMSNSAEAGLAALAETPGLDRQPMSKDVLDSFLSGSVELRGALKSSTESPVRSIAAKRSEDTLVARVKTGSSSSSSHSQEGVQLDRVRSFGKFSKDAGSVEKPKSVKSIESHESAELTHVQSVRSLESLERVKSPPSVKSAQSAEAIKSNPESETKKMIETTLSRKESYMSFLEDAPSVSGLESQLSVQKRPQLLKSGSDLGTRRTVGLNKSESNLGLLSQSGSMLSRRTLSSMNIGVEKISPMPPPPVQPSPQPATDLAPQRSVSIKAQAQEPPAKASLKASPSEARTTDPPAPPLLKEVPLSPVKSTPSTPRDTAPWPSSSQDQTPSDLRQSTSVSGLSSSLYSPVPPPSPSLSLRGLSLRRSKDILAQLKSPPMFNSPSSSHEMFPLIAQERQLTKRLASAALQSGRQVPTIHQLQIHTDKSLLGDPKRQGLRPLMPKGYCTEYLTQPMIYESAKVAETYSFADAVMELERIQAMSQLGLVKVYPLVAHLTQLCNNPALARFDVADQLVAIKLILKGGIYYPLQMQHCHQVIQGLLQFLSIDPVMTKQDRQTLIHLVEPYLALNEHSLSFEVVSALALLVDYDVQLNVNVINFLLEESFKPDDVGFAVGTMTALSVSRMGHRKSDQYALFVASLTMYPEVPAAVCAAFLGLEIFSRRAIRELYTVINRYNSDMVVVMSVLLQRGLPALIESDNYSTLRNEDNVTALLAYRKAPPAWMPMDATDVEKVIDILSSGDLDDEATGLALAALACLMETSGSQLVGAYEAKDGRLLQFILSDHSNLMFDTAKCISCLRMISAGLMLSPTRQIIWPEIERLMAWVTDMLLQHQQDTEVVAVCLACLASTPWTSSMLIHSNVETLGSALVETLQSTTRTPSRWPSRPMSAPQQAETMFTAHSASQLQAGIYLFVIAVCQARDEKLTGVLAKSELPVIIADTLHTLSPRTDREGRHTQSTILHYLLQSLLTLLVRSKSVSTANVSSTFWAENFNVELEPSTLVKSLLSSIIPTFGLEDAWVTQCALHIVSNILIAKPSLIPDFDSIISITRMKSYNSNMGLQDRLAQLAKVMELREVTKSHHKWSEFERELKKVTVRQCVRRSI